MVKKDRQLRVEMTFEESNAVTEFIRQWRNMAGEAVADVDIHDIALIVKVARLLETADIWE